MDSKIVPKDIKLLNKSRLMELIYDDYSCKLSYEFLRIHSPSAEVKGHNPSQYTLQLNKVNIFVKRVELVGSYAIRIIFDDGHETGLYSWEYLEHLVKNKKKLWDEYLCAIQKAGHNRQDWLGVNT